MITCKPKWEKLSKPKKEPKWNIENMKTKNMEFQTHVEEELEDEVEELTNKGQQWHNIKATLKAAADSILGFSDRSRGGAIGAIPPRSLKKKIN